MRGARVISESLADEVAESSSAPFPSGSPRPRLLPLSVVAAHRGVAHFGGAIPSPTRGCSSSGSPSGADFPPPFFLPADP